MQVLNEVLPGFPSPVQLPGGRPALTGLNEADSALAAIHQKSAERITEIVFWLTAFATRTTKRVWQHAALWLHPRMDWQYDQYLQGAVDCADLENRMRDWERRQHGWH